MDKWINGYGVRSYMNFMWKPMFSFFHSLYTFFYQTKTDGIRYLLA